MTPLPTALATHFAVQATIGVPRLAELLPMDRETIKRHIDAERLVGRLKGFGRIKRQFVFTETDIARFLDALAGDGECQSISHGAARSITTTLRSNVIALPDRPSVTMNVTRRPLRKAKRKTLESSSTD